MEEVTHGLDGSEPVRNFIFYLFRQFSVGLVVAFRLENRVPTEVSATSRLHNAARSLSYEELGFFEVGAHVGDDAHRVGCFIWEGLDHFG